MSAFDRQARAQHGLMTSRDLEACRLTKAHIKTMARNGAIIRLTRGLYRVAGAPQTWLQAAMAATLAGSGSVLSHRAAARLLLGEAARPSSVTIEVTAERGRRRALRDGVRCHASRSLPRAHVTSKYGIRCTSPMRTLADLAVIIGKEELEDTVNDFVARNLITPAQFCRFLGRGGDGTGKRAIRSLRRCVDDVVGAATESVAERHLLRLWRAAKLAEPSTQHVVTDGSGKIVARLDFAIPEIRVGVEMDGFRFHGDPASFNRDRLRTLRLVSLGWRILHVSPSNLRDHPEMIIDAIANETALARERVGNDPVESSKNHSLTCAKLRMGAYSQGARFRAERSKVTSVGTDAPTTRRDNSRWAGPSATKESGWRDWQSACRQDPARRIQTGARDCERGSAKVSLLERGEGGGEGGEGGERREPTASVARYSKRAAQRLGSGGKGRQTRRVVDS